MYWIKLDLILLDSQFNRNSLAFHTVILGILGSQMQLRLSDIYMSVFHGDFFFSLRTTGFGLDYTCQKHFTTFRLIKYHNVSNCTSIYFYIWSVLLRVITYFFLLSLASSVFCWALLTWLQLKKCARDIWNSENRHFILYIIRQPYIFSLFTLKILHSLSVTII